MILYRPSCNILGVNVSAVNMADALRYIENHQKELVGEYICVSNVHTTVMSYENEEYKKIQNSAAMVLPDGGPLSTIGRKIGFSNMGRVTGPDLMDEIFKLSLVRSYCHYFLGSTEETLQLLSLNLNKKYPGIKIAGLYSPPFEAAALDREEDDVVNKIKYSSADFIWIGLGAPKQEIWMSKHRGMFRGIMIGVGAGFDYYAGNIKRAPVWMQKNNLEWCYRLFQEPRRLFRRYFKTNIKFLYLTVLHKSYKVIN